MNNIIDKIKIGSTSDLLRMILKVKSVEFNVPLSNALINLIIDFYFKGTTKEAYDEHIAMSKECKNYFKSIATIDNAKTFLKKNRILVKGKNGDLVVSNDYLPSLSKEEDILLEIKILYLHDN